jgi:hypothetical protein
MPTDEQRRTPIDLPPCPWCGAGICILPGELDEEQWVRCGNPYCAYKSEIIEHIETAQSRM